MSLSKSLVIGEAEEAYTKLLKSGKRAQNNAGVL
jgi:hypothetical protein